jgi:hypothetical protein
MRYVIYHKESTRILKAPGRSVGCYIEYYKSEPAAKAALTRLTKKNLLDKGTVKEDYAIADTTDFHQNIEKWHDVRNIMSGEIVSERINTPRSCSVGSELYWSM